jgi:RimJ/RimL family protein N-acetyltransferase
MKKIIVEDKLAHLFKQMFNINLISESQNEFQEIHGYEMADNKKPMNKKNAKDMYEEIIEEAQFLMEKDGFSYYFKIGGSDGQLDEYIILDGKNKLYVGHIAFFNQKNKYGYFIFGSFIYNEYRGKGLPKEIVKMVLEKNGEVVSGPHQSQFARQFWVSLLNHYPDMVSYDPNNGDEYPVYLNNGVIFTSKNDKSMYDSENKDIILKIKK